MLVDHFIGLWFYFASDISVYLYDSLIDDAVYTKNVYQYAQTFSIIIPLLLIATDFYDKWG